MTIIGDLWDQPLVILIADADHDKIFRVAYSSATSFKVLIGASTPMVVPSGCSVLHRGCADYLTLWGLRFIKL